MRDGSLADAQCHIRLRPNRRVTSRPKTGSSPSIPASIARLPVNQARMPTGTGGDKTHFENGVKSGFDGPGAYVP